MRTLSIVTVSAALLLASSVARACPPKGIGTQNDIVDGWVINKQGFGPNPATAFGMCVVVLRDDGGTGAETFACAGKADATHPLDKNTIFAIGSLTKTYTGALFAQHLAQGNLHMTDKVDPLLPAAYREPTVDDVTLGRLATHYSDIARDPPKPLNGFDPSLSPAERDFVSFDDCLQMPGCRGTDGKYQYSNFGFQILGYSVANHDGFPNDWFGDLRWSVLLPLNMNQTMPRETWLATQSTFFNAHAAHAHSTLNADGTWTEDSNPTVASSRCPVADPSGCLMATSHDMRIWLQYNMGLVTPAGIYGSARNVLRTTFATCTYPDAQGRCGNPSVDDSKQGIAWLFDTDSDDEAKCTPLPDGSGYYTRVAKSGVLSGQFAYMVYLQDPRNPTGRSPLGVVLLVNSVVKGTMDTGQLANELLSELSPR